MIRTQMLMMGTIGIVFILLQGCMADMRTPNIKKQGISQQEEQKGRALIEAAWTKHGFSNLKHHQTYGFTGDDIWKGMMGKMGKPWPEAESQIGFKYAVGSFDSQATFLNGQRKGLKAGLQSWNYYEQEPGKALAFVETDERIAFGLSAFHYFFELLDRMKSLPIVAYAGEKAFDGKKFDMVFATWEKAEPHMAHDQYVLWINQATGLLEYAVYSLRDNYLKMPGGKSFYGSIHYEDYRRIEGVLIPHTQTVFLNQPKENDEKHIHRLKVKDFQFDGFPIEELYPDPALTKLGDRKK